MSTRILVAALVLAVSIHVAVAEAPADLTVTRFVYEDPADPNSEVIYTIKVQLSREEVDGDAIGWRVAVVQIEQHDACCADLVWRDDRAAGGEPVYWWTAHADIEHPGVKEFAVMPRIVGVASAVDSEEVDLVYDLQSFECDELDPLCDAYTVSMDYSFRYENESVPVDEKEEEPAGSDSEPGAELQ